MMTIRVVAIGLVAWLALVPSWAGSLSSYELIRVCSFDDAEDVANCAAFLRAIPERLQAQGIYIDNKCRASAFGPSDIVDFRSYAKTNTVPGTSPASVIAANFWMHTVGAIPCASAHGYWTAQQLQLMCRADMSGASSCKFFITSLIDFTKIEAAISGRPAFCPTGKPQIAPNVVSDEDIQRAFDQWLLAKPDDVAAPAAKVFVDAIAAAYPCAR